MKRRKISWKKIICAVLVVALSIGALSALVGWARDDTKSISSTVFERGDIDSNGTFKESNQSICTKERISAVGLTIKPDFEFRGTYDVYLYDEYDVLLDKEQGLTKYYTNKLALAQYARIVIRPEIPADVKSNDFKISFYEVHKYAKMLDVRVSKNDSPYGDFVNLIDESEFIVGKKFASEYTSMNSNDLVNDDEGLTVKTAVTNKIAVTGEYEKYDVYVFVPDNALVRWPTFGLFSESGDLITDENGTILSWSIDVENLVKPCWLKITIEVPDLDTFDGVHICGCIGQNSSVYVYGYND